MNLDVVAFKNIRNRLFVQIQNEIKEAEKRKKSDSVKMYLYLFHLFESVVSHASSLV